jgi:hypothetical protein
VTPTSAPRAASASATALPIPRDPPVTNAVFPARLKSGAVKRSTSDAKFAVAMYVFPSAHALHSKIETKCLQLLTA